MAVGRVLGCRVRNCFLLNAFDKKDQRKRIAPSKRAHTWSLVSGGISRRTAVPKLPRDQLHCPQWQSTVTLPPYFLAQPPSFDAVVSFSLCLAVQWLHNGADTCSPRPQPALFRYRLPRAPETCTPFTRGCMTSEPHSTRFERAPGALSDFSGCSGLTGRTVWRVMMAHLAFGLAKRSVRAVWADFGATVAGHSGR